MQHYKMNILILIILCSICGIKCKKSVPILTVEKMIDCPDRVAKNPNYNNEYNVFRNMTYKKYKLVQVTSGYMVINVGIKKLNSDVFLRRCQTEHESSCETVIKMKFDDICQMMIKKDQAYTPFVESFDPPMHCPLLKGTVYTITNATIDAEKAIKVLQYLPNILNYHWVLRYESKSNNVEVWCIEIWIKMYEIKGRH